MKETKPVRFEPIDNLIHVVRGQRVMLDNDLAAIYGVETGALNRAVKRNPKRFPSEFVFQLAPDEAELLRCQSGISKKGRGGRRFAPYAFTEHGALMAASVLNSERAIEVSVYVVRAFLKLREMVKGHKELAQRMDELERRLATHDVAIREIVEAIKQLAALPEPADDVSAPPKDGIGFLRKRT